MRLFATIGTLVLSALVSLGAQQAPALKIVVLEGEGAVNIIQQKTAVRPLVEVRDRNNLPVAGATVTFSIGGGGSSAAFAGGAQTLTVTTNAVGQAAASGLNAISSGAVQIQVQAAYQGQLATAAISQTNFATAAAAAQAGASAGTGGATSGAAGGAAGGGGGISGTTLGIVGAAVAGGAVAATQLAGQKSEDDFVDSFNGSVDGQIIVTSMSGTPERPVNCSFTRTIRGSMHIDLKADGTGDANLDLTITTVSLTGGCILDTTPRPLGTQDLPVTGGPSAITFGYVYADAVTTDTWRFNGSLSGNTINGTLTLQIAPAVGRTENGSTSIPVTLTGPRP